MDLPRKLSDGWPTLDEAKGWDEVLVFYPACGSDPGGWQVEAISTIWNGLAIEPSHWMALPPAPADPLDRILPKQQRKHPAARLAWTPLSPDSLPPPGRPLLVTNNITSRLANGQMSMLWLVSAVHCTPPRDGSREEFYAYTREGELVRWLTHWRLAIPEG